MRLDLGFIHLGFLAAGAAVAVPLLVHLLLRPRARPVDIGTLQFLRVAVRDQTRRRRVRHWLLLAMRSAGVLLLAMLFARPYWHARGAGGREREIVLLIDRSASMAARGADGSPFEKASRQADEILRGLPGGTKAHLAYFDADGVAPAPEPRLDPDAAPGFSATDDTWALAWARDIMVGSARSDRRVVLWTDLQRSGMAGVLTGDPFPPGVDVEIVDVGRPLVRNLAVEDVQAERTDAGQGGPAIVTARVFNAGLFPTSDVRVELALEGVPTAVQTIALEGHARRTVRFAVPISRPGLYRGSVGVAAGDDLPFDDRRWLAFEARPPDRLLLVDGQPGSSKAHGGATYFLEVALRLGLPGEEPRESRTPYRPERLDWDGRAGSLPALDPFRVVVLCDVPDLSPADAAALSRFVHSGGSLILFTGDQVRSGAYRELEAAGVLPGRLDGPAADGPYRFVAWEKDHPILAPFADPQHGDLRTLRFRTVARIVPDPGSRVLATARGKVPLIVERDHGRGRCLLFAFPADNAWGPWAVHRLFLPMVHQLAGYASRRLPGTGPVAFAPAGRGPAEAPGVVVEDGRALVRNVAPAESEIERTTEAAFRRFYRLPAAKTTPTDAEVSGPVAMAGTERPGEIWPTIAWGLLAVLVAEMFLANRTYA